MRPFAPPQAAAGVILRSMPTAADGTAYELTGTGDPGAPVVALIHGLGLNRHLWRPYAEALSPRHRVLQYDLYGHGDSPPPPSPLSLSLFARQLLNLLDELNISDCIPVGFSIGGMLNRRLAMDAPQRVKALVILNSPHARSAAMQKQAEERAQQTAAEGITPALVENTLERWFTPDFRAAQPAVMSELRRTLMANDPQVFAQCRQILASGVTELVRPQPHDAVQPPISAPALVITAEHDIGSTPAMAHAIAAEMTNAETHITPHLKHMALIEDPPQHINLLLKFLTQV